MSETSRDTLGSAKHSGTSAPTAAATGTRAWWALAGAALVLLAAGTWATVADHASDRPPREDELLRLAAGDLRRAVPDLFAGFLPLGPAERLGGPVPRSPPGAPETMSDPGDLDRGIDIILERAPPEIRRVLAAHWAIRLGDLSAAAGLLEPAGEDSELAMETRAYVRRASLGGGSASGDPDPGP